MLLFIRNELVMSEEVKRCRYDSLSDAAVADFGVSRLAVIPHQAPLLLDLNPEIEPNLSSRLQTA